MKTSLFIGMFLLCLNSFGQQSDKFATKNSVEFELFGQGCFYSLDYERLFLNREKFKTLAQLGVAYYPERTGVIPLWIPVSVNQLFSFHSHHLEAGAGQIFCSEKGLDGDQKLRLFGSLKLGYRYQKPDGKFLFKAAFTPVLDYWDVATDNELGRPEVEFMPWAGVAVGYNF
jgi:hypothetical protein